MNKEILNKIDNIMEMLTVCTKKEIYNALFKIKQLLQAEEQEENKFVTGQVVNWSFEKNKIAVDLYKGYDNKHDMYDCELGRYEVIKLLDWKTLARTISYHIPEAVKAVLTVDNYILFKDKEGEIISGYAIHSYINIPYPNPTGKRQEIDIERG
jgi:hypothetical protein